MKRKEFLKTIGIASTASVIGGNAIASSVIPAAAPNASSTKEVKANADIKLGVSLYSYQHAIYTHDVTLEDCLAELNSIGADTVQIIDGITVENFPNPTQAWVDNWFVMLDKYKLTPSMMNTFLEVYWGWRRPEMTLKEQIDQMVRDLKLAKRLGFKIIRPTSTAVSAVLGEWVDAIVPYAEDLDVKIACELHSPIPLKGEFVDRIMNTVIKTGTKHMGFTLDMGDFPIQSQTQTGGGAYGAAPQGAGAPQTGASRQAAGVPPAGAYQQAQRTPNNPLDLIPLMPYIYNTHGKFYDMADPKTTETYAQVFKVLVENGYKGAIDSEYEGQRNLQNQWCIPIDELYQVRMHHIMMKKLLGRA